MDNNAKIVIFDWGGVIESHRDGEYCLNTAITNLIKHFNNNVDESNLIEKYFYVTARKLREDFKEYTWFDKIKNEFNLQCDEEEFYDFYIKEFNLEKWFDIDKIVYSDGTIKGKPAPDIYEIAAGKLGLKPQECVVVEDAVSGIEAARAAGIGKIVAIASMESPDLYKDIPAVSLIIKDFKDFRAILEVEKAAV